jgi:Rrf2 family protein
MIHSPTCEHALRALIYLAGRDGEGPVLVREIAKGAEAPKQSLSKILHSLRNKGFVRSTKGPGGGYELARPAGEICLLDIVEAVDGRLDLEERCILGLDACGDEASCALHDYWSNFRSHYVGTISSMTLADASEALDKKREG